MKNVKKYIGLLAGTLAVTVITHGSKVESAFRLVPKDNYNVIQTRAKNTNPLCVKGRDELFNIRMLSFLNAGFIISEKNENPYLAIMQYLRKNNLELSSEDLQNLEQCYWFSISSTKFLKQASNILKQPIFYLGEVHILFSNNYEKIMMNGINLAEDIMPFVIEHDNIIIVTQKVSDAFYLITPPQ